MVGEAGKGQGETGREKEAGKRKEGGERDRKRTTRDRKRQRWGRPRDRQKEIERDRNKYTEGDREKSGMERGRDRRHTKERIETLGYSWEGVQGGRA